MGLREKILAAPDADTINTLLQEGEAYVYASVRTRNSWLNAANRKRVELGQTAEERKQEKKIVRQEKAKKTPKHKHGQK